MAGGIRLRTDTLMRRIFKAESVEDALRQNAPSMHSEGFCECLNKLCREQNAVPEQVIRRAQIDRSYGHQLFNGTRKPSRDKVLQLAFGFGLDVEQTQRLLRAAGKSLLYPRLRRDTVILFALGKSMSVFELQELLEQIEPLKDLLSATEQEIYEELKIA